MDGVEGTSGIKVENTKLCVDCLVFPAGHGINVLASERPCYMISEIARICALQACVEGFQVATFEEAAGEIGIF
eukprot:5804671-Karenia_brevis.AAC.1